MSRGAGAVLGAVALAVRLGMGTAPLPAQDAPSRAFDLERRGRHAEAAQLYREMLAGRPGDVGALLGLERALTSLARLGEMTRETGTALALGEPSVALFGIAVRVYTAAGMADSARRAVDRWAALEPESEGPYQEWGAAALGMRDRAQSRLAYQVGRERLGPGALAGELAQLATIEGRYEEAVAEWMLAIGRVPGYRAAAVSMLGQLGPASRPGVLRALDQQRMAAAERVAAALAIRWGDPVGGVRRLERGLPLLRDQAVEALQEALEELRGQRGREALMARGIGLELLGARAPGQAVRLWLEAAQAYAEAGDQQSARRMLSKLAGDPSASPSMAASATSTLIAVLVAEGKLEEAAREFARNQGNLAEEERQDLARRVAEGWIRLGRLGRAADMVAGDSTVEGLAIRGRIQLFQGDLRGASEQLRYAGPFAGAREAAVSRTLLLSLLQVIEADSLPDLGAALLAVERGDSAAGAAGLEQVGAGLPADKGGAEILLLAGLVEAGRGSRPNAEALYRRVAAFGVPASAAQAELELARLLLQRSDRSAAIELLEHLLVTYPGSAVAPQARRLLDEARGAVPPTPAPRGER